MVNMPDGSQNGDDQHAARGKVEDGQTQGRGLKGGSSEVDQPSHCCHHSSCHSSQSHKQSQVIWKQEAEVKSCHNANCRSSAATGLCTTCQSGESQPKQPNHQSQRSGRRMDKGISSPGTGNEIEASPGSQRSTLNSTQDVRSEKESCGSRRRTARAVISGGWAFLSSFIGPPLFSSQEKSGVDANHSADAS